MLPALLLTTMMHHCQLEYRDRPVIRIGGNAQFEVGIMGRGCTLDTLTVVADNDNAGITMVGVNHHDGNDLTVTIRVPRWVKDDTTFYPFAYTTENEYSSPIAALPPFVVT